ncbi:hypothetical protein [Paraburkholderia sp. BL23I1N1]|uniref:hypothetical protein n=1 Tax=Paraburkholderia sp. BL23I1N1 TaxID=1938802 RepID=UPI0011C44021|nr:hypothetical protein [Paraburkholderia sp. BL23I1N1]
MAAVAGLLAAASVFATTTVPVQLLNTSGSSSGQAIISTGPSSAAGWANVPGTALTGIVPVANGGTGLNALTQYNVMVGNATSAVSLIGPSASGTIFASNGASAYPSFQTKAALTIASSGANTDITSLNAPALGAATATTAAAGTNTMQVATTQFTNTIFAAPPCLGCTTAAAVKATTFNASGTITPSTTAGIVGTTLADSASAGSIGYFAANSTAGTSITSGATVNATSISLAAGDYDCWGQALFLPAASTVVANIAAGITTTSATLPASPDTTYLGTTLTTGTNGTTAINAMVKRINISSTTTVYLVAEAGSVTTSTATVNGYLQCRVRR